MNIQLTQNHPIEKAIISPIALQCIAFYLEIEVFIWFRECALRLDKLDSYPSFHILATDLR